MDTPDLWWDAREKTRQMSQPSIARKLVNNITLSLPGAPTRETFAANLLGREKAALVVDLNKYRGGRDLQKFVDAGVDAFILRMGGPSQWTDGAWKYQEDATWRPYMEAVDKIGFSDRVAGYWIQNVFEDWHLDGIISNVTLGLINLWTSNGYMPPAFVCDHEVAEAYRSTGAKFTQTPINIVNSLAETTQKVWNQWRKPVSIYTARWFVNQFAPSEHATYFNNINRPETGKQRGLWLAWVPQTFTKEYANLEDTLSELLTPNGDQLSKLLYVGNSKADLWQYTFTLKLPGDATGVDASVSLGTKEEFFYQFGFKTTPPEPPTQPPDEPPVPKDLQEQINALRGRVEALESFRTNVKGA